MGRKNRIYASVLAAILVVAGFLVGRGMDEGDSTARAGAPASVQGPPVLCGINATLDRLLGCASTAAAPTTTRQQQQQQQQQQKLESARPVVRSSTHATYLPNVLLVRFRSGVSPRRQSALLARLGARTQMRIAKIRYRVVLVEPSRLGRVLAALRASRLVRTANRDELLHVMGSTVNDTFFSKQWGLRLAGFTAAWGKTHGSVSVTVAVVDTGVNAVPDLAGLVLPGVDLVNGDSSATDDNGHGTAVAGVIAAHGNNRAGGAGVCWKCRILPIKVMGANGKGDLATAAAGIVKAVDMGAKVIDLSLGGPAPVPALEDAVAYAGSKGAVVVAAAGNSGLAAPFYPANYANVISVAGTNQSDRLYSWSEHGPWVSVSAPGCNVAPKSDGGYSMFCGTSSATPLVAGLVAYLLSVRPNTTSAQLITAVLKTARHIRTGVAFGRINAGGALTAVRR